MDWNGLFSALFSTAKASISIEIRSSPAGNVGAAEYAYVLRKLQSNAISIKRTENNAEIPPEKWDYQQKTVISICDFYRNS